jgi:uroporphyrinogen-III synthase
VSSLPLAGRRILVTRAVHQAGKLSEGLRALGAVPVEVPVLEIRKPASLDPLDNALRELDHYDWLIVTSANTVRALLERAAEIGHSLKLPSSLKVAAIGEASASAARNARFQVALVPENYVAESLVECMVGLVEGKSVLLARAAIARDVIPEALRAAGAKVDVVDAYQNAVPADAPARLRKELANGIDAATFTSSSSVEHLAEAARAAGLAFPFEGVAAISIGPITTKTLCAYNWPPVVEAVPSDIPGLIAAVAQTLGDRRWISQ